MVGEGIETTCSAAILLGDLPCAAGVSTANLSQSKKPIIMPPQVRTIHLIIDNDLKKQSLHACNAAAYYWQQKGIRVIRRMGAPVVGQDANDVLLQHMGMKHD